ncbi:polysulfide reductase chain A precursor [bacterium BMS3Abin04]|nr:polysulfide reductase chain A precursor [bacterium BMS3Abin04]
MSITRREFLKRGTIAAGAISLLSTTKIKGLTNYPKGWKGRERVQEIPSICEMCFWRCGILGNVDKHGKLLKIDGNPVHPLTHGRLCARGNSGHKTAYDPDRLKYPLMRVGKRGEGKFKRVSWDEALNFMTDKLKNIKEEYGAESVGFFPHGIQARFFEHLMKGFGTPNIAEPAFAQCRGSRDVGYKLTFGNNIGSPEPLDFENTDLMVFIGTHIGENVFTGQNLQFGNAIERGAKLIVVDPRFSVAAAKADYWLPLKPGTDTALLLAWMHVLIYENLYDKKYIRNYAIGFDQLKKHVKSCTPDWAAEITGLPASLILDTAHEMGKHLPKVGVHPGRHVAWYGNDSQRGRAMAILTALLGSYGRPGGIYLSSKIPAPHYPSAKNPKPGPRADGAGTIYPFGSLGLGITNGLVDATHDEDPYPIKAWIVYSQNVIQSIPDPWKTKEAIDKLDLFVVVDILPMEQFLYADLVLPEATYLERYDDLYTVKNAKIPFAAIRQPIIKPLYESKPGWWIAKETAKRLGLEDHFQWDTIEDYLDYRLSALGKTLKEIQNTGIIEYDKDPTPYYDFSKPIKFKTRSGKIELYSQTLKDYGFDPIPVYEPLDDVPKGYFRLAYGRSPIHSFARTQNNEILHGYMPDNYLWINSTVANKLGLVDGEYVNLENQDGILSDKIRLFITPGIHPESVFMVHGFDQKSPFLKLAYKHGASDTYLMSRVNVDPLSGGTGMRVNFVRIIKNGQPIMVSGAVSVVAKFKKTLKSSVPKKRIVVPEATQEAGESEEGC